MVSYKLIGISIFVKRFILVYNLRLRSQYSVRKIRNKVWFSADDSPFFKLIETN